MRALRVRRAVRIPTAAAIAVISVALAAALVIAASPSPPPGGAVGDPRSSGQGPGLVGDPLWAVGVVAVIAVLSLLATLAYVRATANRAD